MRIRPKRPASRRADQREALGTEPRPTRFIVLTLVALVGVLAGSVLGALAYSYENWFPLRIAASLSIEPRPAEAEAPPVSSEGSPSLVSSDTPAAPPTTAAPPPAVRKPVVTAKEDRPAAPDRLTVASILRETAVDAPKVIAADSPRFGMTFEKPPVTAPRQADEEQVVAQADPQPPVNIQEPADTPPEIDEPERRRAAESPAVSEPAVEAPEPASSEPGMRPGEALRYVSLRAGPNKGTREMAVIPANAKIKAEDDCTRWCRVTYDGNSGYIYRTYFRYREIEAVEVAESEADAVAIENRLAEQGADHFKLPTRSSTSAATATREDQSFRWGTTTEFVNLRASPDNDAEVIVIVPANRRILTEEGCTHWCVAIYNGQQGFMYKAYIQPPG